VEPNENSPARLWALRTITVLVWALIISVIAATAVGFWLSYAGLHSFGYRAGLRGPEAWAWPASVDLFILAGELGVTISAVKREHDGIAWAYLIGGAGLSVLFNVLHVWVPPVWWGRYAVAAVPPIAAIAALAALMRQVFRGVTVESVEPGAGLDEVSSPVFTDAESAAAVVLKRTADAGNPFSKNQLERKFRLSRAEATNVYNRVIPQPPAGTDFIPPGDAVPAGLNGNGSHV